MTRARMFAAAMLCIAACLASPAAHASRCLDSGSFGADAICAGGVYTSLPTYTICDDTAAYVYRQHAWCVVLGGTWDPNIPGCIGLGGVTPGSAQGAASAFEDIIHGTQCRGGGTPGPCSDYYCTCHTATSMGLVTLDYSLMPFSGRNVNPDGSCGTVPWTENVVLTKQQRVGCPPGFALGSGDADRPCMRPVLCLKCLGNPVDVGAGVKLAREVDYASPAPGGLRFERHYNSAGYFDTVQRDLAITDFWRHSYSAKIYPYSGNAYVMAMAMRPNGALIAFNLSGVEMQNVDGAANRMQKLTDGGGALTGWKLTTPESDNEQYDAQGRLTSITTRSGFVTTLAYDGSGRLQTVSDAVGRSLTLGYDTSGRLATMTDPASSLYQYGYDAQGRLATVTYPDNKIRTYVYEDTRWMFALTGIIDERGARYSTYGYDVFGKASSTEHAGSENKYTLSWADYGSQVAVSANDAFNTQHLFWFARMGGALKMTSHGISGIGTENLTYDANANPASVTDRIGTVTNYVYDAARNLETSRTEAAGTPLARTIATTWHPTLRLPATITEPSGVAGVNLVTTFTYDPAGNLTKKNLTAGARVREWNYTYNARGQVLTIDGPRTDAADVTTIAYYADNDTCVGCRGQVYTVTNAAGHVTTFNSYNLDGRPTQITDANGVATALTYKPRGWLASRTVAGETTTYDYDFVGNLSKVTLSDGSWVAYNYDAANGLVGMDDSMGNAIDYELDVMGNRVRENVFDPANQLATTLQRVYDGVNRLQKDLGAAAQATQYGYDVNYNLITVTDPLFRVTTSTYDVLNRLTNVNDAANGDTSFTYDAKDRLASVKDPKLSVRTTYTYDGLGNLIAQVSPDTGTTTFTYDDAGNVATQTDARSTATSYTYDALNRVTAATVTDGTVSYEYDNTATGGAYAKGRLTKVTDPSGNTNYVYDSRGRVTSKMQTVIATPGNKTFTVGYSYANGRQTGITYPSGRAITYGFNALGQVTSITVDGTTTVLSSAAYFPFGAVSKWTWGNGQPLQRTFDQDGRIKTLTLGPSTATYADLSQVFGYDSLNRLITANLAAGQAQSFTYDANGNRTNATVNAASTNYTYPGTSHELSSLSGATTRSFTYDNAGNVTSTLGVTYVYDGRGRMKQAGATTYLANGLGQRVKKSSGSDTYFAYDEAGRLIGEYDSSGAAIQETLWLGDTPVAIIRPKQSSGFDVFYIWADHLGTPRQITDNANQSRWEWPHNDPFGNNAPSENPAGLGAFSYNLRFPGQYFDIETGTHYNYFRDYDPSIGRYVESDPIGLRAGLNTYSYVGGNPLSGTDELGLYDCTYSIGSHAMSCKPNDPGHPSFGSSNFVSGNNQNAKCPDCQNNPNRTGVSDHGPLPTGDYSVGPQQQGSSRRDLKPGSSTNMGGRFGMQVHGCGNPQTCSDGCIAATTNKDRDRFNLLMGLEEGRNTMHVTP